MNAVKKSAGAARPSITDATRPAIGSSTSWSRAKFDHARRGTYAFGHHRGVAEDLLQRTPSSEFGTDPSVPALLARARRNEITDAREPGEGQRVTPERHARAASSPPVRA